jgi:hypothetical protein
MSQALGQQRPWGTHSKSCLRHEQTPVLSLSSLFVAPCVPPAMWSWLSDRPRNSLSPRNCCFEMSNKHAHAPIHSGGGNTPPQHSDALPKATAQRGTNAPAMQGPNPLSQLLKRRTCVPFVSSPTVFALNPKPCASTVTNLADCSYRIRRRPLSPIVMRWAIFASAARCANLCAKLKNKHNQRKRSVHNFFSIQVRGGCRWLHA